LYSGFPPWPLCQSSWRHTDTRCHWTGAVDNLKPEWMGGAYSFLGTFWKQDARSC